MRFEWDLRKAAANHTKDGVTFETAMGVFRDPKALTEFDDTESPEERWRLIGSTQGGVLFVVFIERSDDIIRIISARRATRHEQDRYYRQAFPET